MSSYPYQFTILGAFVHQSPKLRFARMQNTNSVEIGDLLIVHIHKEADKITNSVAQLLQAKRSRVPHFTPPSGDDQHRLYLAWPEFKYVSPRCLNGVSRDVFPKQPTAGAKYMLIDERKIHHPDHDLLGDPCAYTYGVADTADTMSVVQPFRVELFEILAIRAGRVWDMSPMENDGWSNTINDLLTLTMNSIYNRRNVGRHRQPRVSEPRTLLELLQKVHATASGSENNMDLADKLHQMTGGRGGGRTDDPFSAYDDDDGGIPTIYIESNTAE